MTSIIEIAGARVGIHPIADGDNRLTRRQRERQAVEAILCDMLGRCTLTHRPDGAPAIDGIPYLSITHSKRLAAVAIHPSAPIGIDAEEDRRDTLRRVKERFLTASEMQWIDDDHLLDAWTIKEAVYKAAAAPGLAGTDIALHPGLAQATAQGHVYAIDTLRLGPTLLTLATQKA